MLEQVFLKVIDMSREASLVILIVFITRILLKNFPKYISYMLWSVVLFRLLCPVMLESEIGLVPKLEPVFQEYTIEKDAVQIENVDEDTGTNEGGSTIDVLETGQAVPEQFYYRRKR